MKIESLIIKNYKFIHFLEIKKMENACILIGRNNTGKTVILDAVMTAFGQKEILKRHFNENNANIEITIRLSINDEDLEQFRRFGTVSRYKKNNLFMQDFLAKFPSYKDGCLTFTFVANNKGKVRYSDGIKKDNRFIPLIFPKIYYIDHRRDIREIETDILQNQMREKTMHLLRENRCMFDEAKTCNGCFNCIGMIMKKSAEDLSVFESEKLLEYKIMNADNTAFLDRLNACFRKNTGFKDNLVNRINIDVETLFKSDMVRLSDNDDYCEAVYDMSEGIKSIYILSLLEAYMQEKEKMPCIMLMEDPELFLHPQLQKTASEILYRLSEKNQILFSTHSPTMIFNFARKHIKQVVSDKEGNPVIREENDIDRILDDLGYSANDLMNVGFVFIVEGKQDKSRLPLLIKKYYSDVVDEAGRLKRIAIISTNSCTNIKTYANLKYINQLYLKDQFLMIRDGDGKNPDMLKADLCNYYHDRGREDFNSIPRVSGKNVLILKYYSFENYFLNPVVMAKIGVIKDEDSFYNILYGKYKEYLYKIKSFVKLREEMGIEINGPEDIKNNLEEILIYGRGHNLFDIFYGKYKGEKENEILRKYIDNAERDTFKDILDGIDSFVYFDSKRIR